MTPRLPMMMMMMMMMRMIHALLSTLKVVLHVRFELLRRQ